MRFYVFNYEYLCVNYEVLCVNYEVLCVAKISNYEILCDNYEVKNIFSYLIYFHIFVLQIT